MPGRTGWRADRTAPVRAWGGGWAVAAAVALLPGFVALPAGALELWVDHDSRGGPCDDARTRSDVGPATPWCTLGAAGSRVQAGDTVHVRGGDYVEVQTCPLCNDNSVLQVVASGAADAWIRFVAEPGETVQVLGTDGAVHGVQVIRTWDDSIRPRFVEIAGFTIRGLPTNCVAVADTSDVVLRGLDVSGCGGGAVELHRTARVTVEGCRIHDNPMDGSTSAVDLYLCLDGNVVRGNFIWANTDEDAADTEGHGITMDTCGAAAGALIENNVIWDNEGWCLSMYQGDGGVIRNNTCWMNGRRDGAGEVSILGDHYRVHNNVLVPRDGRLALNIRQRPDYPVDAATIESDYNILWAPTHDVVVGWLPDSQGTVAEYQAANPRGWDAHALQQDPLLADPGAADFHLLAGSSAIDSGDDANAPATDADGRARPADGDGDGTTVVDRGAYELGAGPGPDADADADVFPDVPDANADADADGGSEASPGSGCGCTVSRDIRPVLGVLGAVFLLPLLFLRRRSRRR